MCFLFRHKTHHQNTLKLYVDSREILDFLWLQPDGELAYTPNTELQPFIFDETITEKTQGRNIDRWV